MAETITTAVEVGVGTVTAISHIVIQLVSVSIFFRVGQPLRSQRSVIIRMLRYSVPVTWLLIKLFHGLGFKFGFGFWIKSTFLILDTKRWLKKKAVVRG